MASGEWGGAFNQRVFRATIQFERAGQKCQTGFHLRDVGINTLDAEEVATEVADWATEQFAKLLQTTDRITGIDVENLVSREGHSVSPANLIGILASTSNPSFITVSVALKGSLRRRYGSGRMLWPVASAVDVNVNQLAAAGITRFQAVIDDLLSRFVGPSITTSMHLVHLHEALPALNNRPAVPAMWYDITSARLNTTLSMLRRRRQGVGS